MTFTARATVSPTIRRECRDREGRVAGAPDPATSPFVDPVHAGGRRSASTIENLSDLARQSP